MAAKTQGSLINYQNPYQGQTVEYLYNIMMAMNCVGFAQLTVTDGAAVDLNAAITAINGNLTQGQVQTALIRVIPDATATNNNIVIRYREDGVTVTTAVGMSVGAYAVFEVKRPQNLTDFSVIGVEAGKTHTLEINFYG